MRKQIFLFTFFLSTCCYLQAQQTAEKVSVNYGVTFAKGYQENDLYEIEIKRAEKQGYALQVGSFSTYANVIKYVTTLQGKWIKNILLRQEGTVTDPIYKVLIGPFPDKQTTLNYQKEKELTGFVTSLEEKNERAPVAVSKEELVEKGPPPVIKIPTTKNSGFSQTGESSYYGVKFHGRMTASGEIFNSNAYTAAHWTLPFNTILNVCRLDNQKCVKVRVNDRGPNPAKAIGKDGKPRIVDLSLAAAKKIDLVQSGVTQVHIEVIKDSPEDAPSKELNKETSISEKQVVKKSIATQVGEASYYAAKFHGSRTAYGETYDNNAYTAAHWTLPNNTMLNVCRLDNQKCVKVRVNDRGPNPAKAIGKNGKPRIIDLSLAAAKDLDLVQAGLAQVRVEVLE